MAESITTALRKADQLVASGRSRRAVAVLRPLAVTHPRQPEVWYRLAAAHLEQRHPADALAAAKQALRLGADPARAYRLISQASHDLGDHAGAIRAAGQAVRIDASDWRNHLTAAKALLAAGRSHESVDSARRAAGLAGAEPDPLRVLGDAAVAIGDIRAAERAYRAVLRDYPDDHTVRARLAKLRQLRAAKPEASWRVEQEPRERALPTPPVRQPRPATREPVQMMCWRELRRLSMTLLSVGMLLLVAGLPSPAPILAWFGFALAAVLAAMAVVALIRIPAAERSQLPVLVRQQPQIGIAGGLVTAGAALLLTWSSVLATGTLTVEPLVFALICAGAAGGLCLLVTSR